MKLTKEQSKKVTRELSFSLNGSLVTKLIAAFPSVTFKCDCQNNGGVTTDYTLTGPSVWIEKIELKYAY
jgi:hypothetical protein